jgi:hypothetical protein
MPLQMLGSAQPPQWKEAMFLLGCFETFDRPDVSMFNAALTACQKGAKWDEVNSPHFVFVLSDFVFVCLCFCVSNHCVRTACQRA